MCSAYKVSTGGLERKELKSKENNDQIRSKLKAVKMEDDPQSDKEKPTNPSQGIGRP